MSEPFGDVYADNYDLVYSDKDYVAECDLIERVFRQYANGPVRSVLDLGCGTGSHAIPLAQRGYRVVGIDRAEEMLTRARQKAAQANCTERVEFAPGDVRQVDVGERFDAALMMFAVLGYQVTNQDVRSALASARRHLSAGGLLVFDVWYGPAVLRQRPSPRIKVVSTSQGRLLRVADGQLNVNEQLCRVDYHVWHLQDKQVVAESQESHVMRYFFPKELDLFLEDAGFEGLRLGSFPDFDRAPDEATWNVLVAARAV